MRRPVGVSGRRRIGAEPLEQFQRRATVSARRRVEPVERPRIAAPREDVEQRARRFDAVRCPASRCGRSRSRRVPQPHDAARAEAAGAAARWSAASCEIALRLEAVDARDPDRSAPPCAGRCRRPRVTPGTVSDVSAMFVARIDRAGRRRARARDPARRRRAIRGAARRRRRPRGARPRLGRRAADLGAPGRKHSTCPSVPRAAPPTASADGCRRRDSAIVDAGAAARARRPPGSRPVRRHRRRVHRRRHHDDPQIVAGAATPAARARSRGRRGCCARGTRRGRWCESRTAADRAAARAVRMPSVASSTRVAAGSAARSGPASRPRGRASSPARRRSGGRWCAPRSAAAAARARAVRGERGRHRGRLARRRAPP